MTKQLIFQVEQSLREYGAQLLKKAATKTNLIAGGGTTTATVLAHALVSEVNIIRRALEEPLRVVARNAGWDDGVSVANVRHKS